MLRLSAGNLEYVALFRPRACRPYDAAKSARHPPLPPDHLAHVVGGDEETEDDGVLALLGLHTDGVRLVDQPSCDPLEKLSH